MPSAAALGWSAMAGRRQPIKENGNNPADGCNAQDVEQPPRVGGVELGGLVGSKPTDRIQYSPENEGSDQQSGPFHALELASNAPRQRPRTTALICK